MTIALNSQENERINWMMKTYGIKDPTELIDSSLFIMKWAIDQILQGRNIASIDEMEKVEHILLMPLLSAIEENANKFGKKAN